MATDIEERPNDTVVVTDDGHTGAADIDDTDVSGLRHVAFEPDKNPVAMKEDLDFRLKDIGPRVKFRRKRVSLLPSAQKRAY
jgi:hypothetical protein